MQTPQALVAQSTSCCLTSLHAAVADTADAKFAQKNSKMVAHTTYTDWTATFMHSFPNTFNGMEMRLTLDESLRVKNPPYSQTPHCVVFGFLNGILSIFTKFLETVSGGIEIWSSKYLCLICSLTNKAVPNANTGKEHNLYTENCRRRKLYKVKKRVFLYIKVGTIWK